MYTRISFDFLLVMTSQIYVERNNADKDKNKTGKEENLFPLVSVSLLLAEVRSSFSFCFSLFEFGSELVKLASANVWFLPLKTN